MSELQGLGADDYRCLREATLTQRLHRLADGLESGNRHDTVVIVRLLREAIGRIGELEQQVHVAQSDAARALGRSGAAAGGKARATSLSPERRSEIARQAALTRWAKRRGEGSSR